MRPEPSPPEGPPLAVLVVAAAAAWVAAGGGLSLASCARLLSENSTEFSLRSPRSLGPAAGCEPEDHPAHLERSDGLRLLYPGVNTLSGEPTSGKTWLALLAVRQVLDAGLPVAFVDFEDRPSRVVARLLAIGATPDQIRALFRYVRPDHALDTAGLAALQKAVTGTALAVLDGVTEAMTMHDLELNSNKDVSTFYALLPRRIADLGPTVVLIDHVVKDNEKQGRWSLGGQHKAAILQFRLGCLGPLVAARACKEKQSKTDACS